MLALIDTCAELGGKYLVHGSPQQRRVEAGETRTAAMQRAQASFAAVAERAEKAGVVYCIEALAAESTPLINTLEEAAPHGRANQFRCGQDHARLQRGGAHGEGAARRADRALGAEGRDRARAGQRPQPARAGAGRAEVCSAVRRIEEKQGYAGDIAVEPFDYVPDGPSAAARAIGYLRGVLEALEERPS